MKYLANSILHVAIIVGFCLLGPMANSQPAAGQARSPGAVARRIEEFNAQAVKASRDELNREMNGRTPSDQQSRLTRLKKTAIREDLETLQSSYNELVTKLHSKETPSDAFVLDVTERVRKASTRLQDNIEFLAIKERKPSPPTASASKGSLRELCVILHAFLTNPLFETGAFEVAEADKARDVLDKIVQLSGTLHNQVGKIN